MSSENFSTELYEDVSDFEKDFCPAGEISDENIERYELIRGE